MEKTFSQDVQYVYHSSNERGKADYGWLKTNYSFSFANYLNPQKMGFGLLKVLNDDYIAPGKGFGTHSHENMEIVTIPLSGELEHKDSKGNHGIIKKNDIQIMNAGKGIKHSEFNPSKIEITNTLQTWILPDAINVEPRYKQLTVNPCEFKNNLRIVVAPNTPDALHINQKAIYAIGDIDSNLIFEYKINFEGNGVYVFLIEGELEILDKVLNKRDAIGIWNTDKIILKPKVNSKVLLIEVPMK
jgi:hypothetical protein